MALRLFAAVGLPAPVVGDLDRVLADRADSLRWSPAQRWHVTTAFYGEVPEASLPRLADRLARAADRTAPFSLHANGFGGFPSTRRARIVVARLAGDTEALGRLAARCTAAGRRTGLTMETRRFRPHVTIARSRTDVDVTELLPAYDGPSWRVDELRLVRSTLGAEPRHDVVDAWPLTGG